MSKLCGIGVVTLAAILAGCGGQPVTDCQGVATDAAAYQSADRDQLKYPPESHEGLIAEFLWERSRGTPTPYADYYAACRRIEAGGP